jgi:hypothetical protein
MLVKGQTQDGYSLFKLQMLKEYAGQERAYIYSMLLSNKQTQQQIKKIQELIKEQSAQKEEFVLNTSIDSTLIYNNISRFFIYVCPWRIGFDYRGNGKNCLEGR